MTHVSLAEANRILVRPDGAERGRVASAAGDPLPLDAPSGVAVSGTRVLVTNQSSTANDASHWAVLTVTF